MITPQKRARYIAPDGSLTQEGILFLLSIETDVNAFQSSIAQLEAKFMPEAFGANVSEADIASTGYKLLVDISDTVNYPHDVAGDLALLRMDLTVDRTGTSQGILQVGVIGAIDGTEADIFYTQGFSFEKNADQSIQRDRAFASPFRMKVADGKPVFFQTDFTETTAAVNTGITLETGAGTTVTPAVGDIIMKYTHSGGGVYSAAISTHYTMEAAT